MDDRIIDLKSYDVISQGKIRVNQYFFNDAGLIHEPEFIQKLRPDMDESILFYRAAQLAWAKIEDYGIYDFISSIDISFICHYDPEKFNDAPEIDIRQQLLREARIQITVYLFFRRKNAPFIFFLPCKTEITKEGDNVKIAWYHHHGKIHYNIRSRDYFFKEREVARQIITTIIHRVLNYIDLAEDEQKLQIIYNTLILILDSA